MNYGVISAGDLKTAQAGEEILIKGGNAYDALVASLLAAPLCEPILTSLGGGGFMLCSKAGEKPLIYDFFVDVPPVKEDREFFPIEVDFGTTKQEFHIGASSIAVPGMVKGIWSIYEDLCTLPMDELVKPAVKYARDGIYLSKIQADFLKLLEPIFTSTKGSRDLYTYKGEMIDENHLFKNLKYASFLERFAKEGESLFYKGEVANEIDKLSKEHKGLVDSDVLANYKVIKREPIEFEYKGYEIFTNPPPSSGGILLAFALLMLEEYDLDKFDKSLYLKLLTEVQKISGDFRKERVDEFIHKNGLEEILKDDSLLEVFRKKLKQRVNLWGNTTHISIIDRFGNGASCTSTNGEGSGYVLDSCGIMLNNMLGEEDLNPHGFFAWKEGVRLPSMMSPTALLKENRLSLLLGSAGSNRIRSALLQTIVNFADFKENLQNAINAPRVHFENGTIFCEPPLGEFFSDDTEYEIKKFKELNLFFGGVQAVGGDFDGGADIRRGASVIKVTKGDEK